ncbi:ferredoxin [Mycolicibacterium novocastrense]|uniref:ferredoxin n=1 Tax=Mycolicibacterium novocastrense TaxID=59813 RepID=UPI000746B8F6|nr:ferredoxin [Mycolicibacterium novocastrense]KUH70792.1 ferredoxin [Mycolicibacterium novocastrense]KUH71133.1 ferredoxin [Mycolicibacterium novocastrense]KUH73350.1 ferredoxin [Mycolicibacterium novocastrense]
MRVSVDDDACRGHGVCVSLCPSVFVIADLGYAETTDPEIPAALEVSVIDAAQSCPESAIHVAKENHVN